MSTEEPAWKAELEKELAHVLRVGVIDIRARVTARDAVLPFLFEAIQAAEERGRREALERFVCGVCGHRVGWIDCPTGGWWAHEVHPSDEHDAVECTPESESP